GRVNLALRAGRDAHEGSPLRGVVAGGSARVQKPIEPTRSHAEVLDVPPAGAPDTWEQVAPALKAYQGAGALSRAALSWASWGASTVAASTWPTGARRAEAPESAGWRRRARTSLCLCRSMAGAGFFNRACRSRTAPWIARSHRGSG